MRAGRQTKMRRGAIWACVIPVGLGIIGIILLLLAVVHMASIGADYWDDILILLPIIACFIFGAPLIAWLACRSLAKISSAEKLSRWKSSASRGFLNASLVHLVWACLYTIGVMVSHKQNEHVTFRDLDPDYNILSEIFLSSLVLNLMLWIIITLPLSLLCATIFWKVTKFPENTDVF